MPVVFKPCTKAKSSDCISYVVILRETSTHINKDEREEVDEGVGQLLILLQGDPDLVWSETRP